MTFYLASFGKYPFPGITKETVNDKILHAEPEMFMLEFASEECKEFIMLCLNKNRSDRQTAEQLLEHEWM